MSAETLLSHYMVPKSLPASSRRPAELQVHHIRGVRYLVVDQTANRRYNSKVSKIW
jgi:hypothetical protein